MIGDIVPNEGDKFFLVNLTNANGNALITNDRGLGVIHDDDFGSPPQFESRTRALLKAIQAQPMQLSK